MENIENTENTENNGAVQVTPWKDLTTWGKVKNVLLISYGVVTLIAYLTLLIGPFILMAMQPVVHSADYNPDWWELPAIILAIFVIALLFSGEG
jgi:hypothetical protein